MKSFSFNELLLLSNVEAKARRISLHPKGTVFSGENETGKSSALKALFRTFGANPEGESPRWKLASVRSVVRFEVDGERYSFLRYGDQLAAFDSKNRLIKAFASVTKEVAPFLSKLFGFRLQLPNRQHEFVDLPPAYLFLPFYMDQDGSWSQPWSAFTALTQFARWKDGVIEYHAGIRGRAYYEAQAEKLGAEVDRDKATARKEGLESVYKDLSKEFQAAQFDVDYSAYQGEVEALLSECEKLRKREERFKVELTQLRNQQDSLKTQLAITEHARNESDKDYEFASAIHDEIGCPTCGAVYDNSFKQRFLLAVDEDTCTELALHLKQEIEVVGRQLEAIVRASGAVATERDEIEKLLAKREGELELRDLIRQDGRKELKRAMNTALGSLEAEASEQVVKASAAGERMKKLDSPKRRKEVNEFYASKMTAFAHELEIGTLPHSVMRKIDVPPRSTGSEGARVLLAYKVAFLWVMKEFGDCSGFPFVVDSPKQQEQDARHSRKILEFLKNRLPEQTQLVLGVVDPENVRFPGKHIALEQKLSLLRSEEFESVSGEVKELVDVMLRQSPR
jgi:hypothetical protein